MNIETPEFSLVVLVGPTSAGKTTFARGKFGEHEVISSDTCRALVSDDPTSQRATSDAFDLLHAIVDKRLKNRRLTVVDATSLQQNARAPLVQLARDHDCPITAIVFDLPQDILYERNRARPDRDIPDRVVRNHIQALARRNASSARKDSAARRTSRAHRKPRTPQSSGYPCAPTRRNSPAPSTSSATSTAVTSKCRTCSRSWATASRLPKRASSTPTPRAAPPSS